MFGQRFRPGFIILNDSTKLTGLVEAKSISNIGDYIRYKPTSKSKLQKLPLSEISSFTSGERTYFKAYVKVDISAIRDHKSIKSYEDYFSRDTILLEVVFDGDKPLYRGYYANKEQFYIKTGNEIQLLEAPTVIMRDTFVDPALSRYINRYNYQVSTEVTGGEKKITIDTYKYQLTNYLSDWPEVNSLINDIYYNYYGLKYLFNRYYEFKAPYMKRKFEISNAEFGLFNGCLIEKVNISSDEQMFYYMTTPDFPLSTSLFLGAFLQTNFGQTDYHFSLYYSIGYYNFYTKALFGRSEDGGRTIIYTYSNFDVTSIKARLAGKYNVFIGHGTRLSLSAGMSYTIPVHATNSVLEYGVVLSQPYYNSFEGFISPYQKNSYIRDEVGGFVGLSLQRDRLALDTWVEMTNGFLSPVVLIQKNIILGITLSLTFFKAK